MSENPLLLELLNQRQLLRVLVGQLLDRVNLPPSFLHGAYSLLSAYLSQINLVLSLQLLTGLIVLLLSDFFGGQCSLQIFNILLVRRILSGFREQFFCRSLGFEGISRIPYFSTVFTGKSNLLLGGSLT
ncbi:Uncharacterised protein [Klebsiella pneumoniae]|nr:Uncharacterised protein [Klebsiella pneumoniae]